MTAPDGDARLTPDTHCPRGPSSRTGRTPNAVLHAGRFPDAAYRASRPPPSERNQIASAVAPRRERVPSSAAGCSWRSPWAIAASPERWISLNRPGCGASACGSNAVENLLRFTLQRRDVIVQVIPLNHDGQSRFRGAPHHLMDQIAYPRSMPRRWNISLATSI